VLKLEKRKGVGGKGVLKNTTKGKGEKTNQPGRTEFEGQGNGTEFGAGGVKVSLQGGVGEKSSVNSLGMQLYQRHRLKSGKKRETMEGKRG